MKSVPQPEQGVPQLLNWYRTSKRDLPWRRSSDPYAIWISESMLQQTQVQTVIPYYERWMREVPDITSLAKLPEDKGLKLWEGLGYYNRMRNLVRAARAICENHGGRIPSDYHQLLELPGIGPYTAGAISSIAFNQAQPILDGNVARVLSRFHGIREPVNLPATRDRLLELARSWVESASHSSPHTGRHCSDLNQGLMELGAEICTPRNPDCPNCPIHQRCVAKIQNLQGTLPNKSPKAPVNRRTLLVLLMKRQASRWIEQRKNTSHNKGFWQFPELEVERGLELEEAGDKARALASKFGGDGALFLARIRHTITNNQFELLAFESHFEKGTMESGPGKWASAAEIEKLPFSSAHRKILKAIRPGKKPCHPL